MLTKYLVGVVIALLAAYGLFEARPLLTGPTLTIYLPSEDEAATSSVVLIQGTALRATRLTLNGAPLYTDEFGHFSTTLAFPQGTSILTFAAEDRFGRTISKARTIVVP